MKLWIIRASVYMCLALRGVNEAADVSHMKLHIIQDVKLSNDIPATNGTGESTECSLSPSGILSLPNCHSLSAEINRITMEQLRYAKAGVEEQVVHYL